MNSPLSLAFLSDMVGSTTWESNSASNTSCRCRVAAGRPAPFGQRRRCPQCRTSLTVYSAYGVIASFDPHLLAAR